jgi:hypothetical protein
VGHSAAGCGFTRWGPRGPRPSRYAPDPLCLSTAVRRGGDYETLLRGPARFGRRLPDLGQFVRVDAEQVGDLFDDYVMDQVGKVFAVHRAKFQRPTVEHDARG